MIYNLIVGDWSGDGHSQTESIRASINLTEEQIARSFENGLGEHLDILFPEKQHEEI